MIFTYTNEQKEEVSLDVQYTILPVKLGGQFKDVLLDVAAYNSEKEDVFTDLDFEVRDTIEAQCFFDHSNR